ncbi:hypothetical protein BJ546DRAFT_997205 [Cryomyces antarcticus]
MPIEHLLAICLASFFSTFLVVLSTPCPLHCVGAFLDPFVRPVLRVRFLSHQYDSLSHGYRCRSLGNLFVRLLLRGITENVNRSVSCRAMSSSAALHAR